MSSLVIVESPAKAKTLARILGRGYRIAASFGHIRDLPERADQIPERFKKESWARLGVNVERDFEPLYVIPQDKKKHIRELKTALEGADELLLATDEDREGESISWHVVEVLKPKVPVRRIVFHEITDEAIHEALESPRDIDSNLVRAQESRRILDRLFGYELSPLLWKKVRGGLSAGRVQSVAVRLCVLRERERMRFVAAGYWDAEAEFEVEGKRFTARLLRLGGERLATGQDFDPDTGRLKHGSRALWIDSRERIERAIAGWDRPFRVSSVEEKPLARRPAPPFTTATLQQEAHRRLRFTARRTMRVAQRLYEGIEAGGDRVGLITYMRTDSVTLARRALAQAQEVIRQRYGEAFAKGPRQYKTKSKSAQEAHEGIRPTDLRRTPDRMARFLEGDERKLYELIWRRTVASQMPDARLRRTAVEITAPVAAGSGDEGVFAATGTTIEFAGFLRAWGDGSDDSGAEKEVLLPPLATGDACEPLTVEPRGRETAPPARFTEASLVKKLESEGIGRPSTYAPILDTIQRRGYVFKQGSALVPTFTAMAVTQLLEEHFRDYVDTTFTARMEQQLDDIAGGALDWKDHLEGFYFGRGDQQPGLERRIASQEPDISYPALEVGKHPETGRSIVIKIGRYGPYLRLEGNGDQGAVMASLAEDLAPADLTVERAVELLERARQGARLLGEDPESGEPVYLAHGRFGAYVQLGETPERGSGDPKPKRASLPRGLSEDSVRLQDALRWLSLPRTLGADPESGEEVIATSGRFGPFVKRGTETRSLTAEDDVYNVSLERALELLAQPKARRGRATRTVLAEFADGDRKLQLLEGRYGPYLTDGELNASLPRGTDPASLDAEAAVRLLDERGKPPKRKRAAKGKKAPKKKTPKKATPKKAAKPKKAKTRRKPSKKKA